MSLDDYIGKITPVEIVDCAGLSELDNKGMSCESVMTALGYPAAQVPPPLMRVAGPIGPIVSVPPLSSLIHSDLVYGVSD